MNNKRLLPDYEGHDLTNYNNFLIECLEKDYSGQGTQKHHIFSKKFMGGTDDEENLITLNYLDHFNAHMILARCFPKGHINRGRNYASAKLIVGNVRGHLQKRYGNEFDENAIDFWEIAHREVCELNRGENHPQFGTKLSEEQCKQMSERMKGKYVGELNHFFGKTHTEETKELIREKRKLQIMTDETRHRISESNKGEKNSFFGKTHTEETKELISDRIKDYYKNNPKPKIEIDMPAGLFRCDEIINGVRKNIYRFCPECGDKIFHKIKETPCYINNLSESKSRCKSCANSNRMKPIKELKVVRNTGRNKEILDTRTGQIFSSMNQFMRTSNIRRHKCLKLIENGILTIIKDNYISLRKYS